MCRQKFLTLTLHQSVQKDCLDFPNIFLTFLTGRLMALQKITIEKEHLMQIKCFQQQFNITHLKEEAHPQCKNL